VNPSDVRELQSLESMISSLPENTGFLSAINSGTTKDDVCQHAGGCQAYTSGSQDKQQRGS
jgi:hypothetical protein